MRIFNVNDMPVPIFQTLLHESNDEVHTIKVKDRAMVVLYDLEEGLSISVFAVDSSPETESLHTIELTKADLGITEE